MVELKQKFGCFKVDKIEDRCIKVEDEYKGEKFPSLKDCIKNCNTQEEQEKLDNLKEHFRLKTTVEFIRPKLIDTFDKMNDLPILNVDGKIYNRKLLNLDEIQMLYVTLSFISLKKNRNLFLEDIVKSLNGKFGLDMKVTTLDLESFEINTDIIYMLNYNKKYAYQFLSDEYKRLFYEEIKLFYESNNIYLIKNVHIDRLDGNPGHHTQVLIKKNISSGRIKLEAFIYDSISNGIINPISEEIEEFLNSQIKYEHSVFNLSKIYGLQDFERLNNNNYMKFVTKNVTAHINSIIDVLRKLLIDLKSVYLDYKKNNIPFSPKAFTKFIMNKYFSKLFERHFLINDIKTSLRKLIDDILLKEKEYLDEKFIFSLDSAKEIKEIKELLFIIKMKVDNLLMEINEINIKNIELQKQINNQYNFDFFEGNCYLWSYYTVILILINPNIQPYDIIKASYYQSSKINRMHKLFNFAIESIESIKNQLNYAKKYFDQDYIKNQNLRLEKDMKKIQENKVDVELLEHTRLVYIKITNLILINTLYNRLENKYLLYTLEKGCQEDICEKKMIPEKVNEILDKLSFDEKKLTKESILEIIKRGKKINDINSVILKDKSTVPNDYQEYNSEPRNNLLEFKYGEKYLKYKNKYLLLKNQLKKN